MNRFIVVSSKDARANRYPGYDDPVHDRHFLDGWCWCLYETDGEKPIRLIAEDGGEPEDQCLVRDWDWVPTELNKLASRIAELEGK